MTKTAAITEARNAENGTTEERAAHHAKCKGLVWCDCKTDKVNEYGDCYDCDGEGKRMCLCQDWTWEQIGQ